MKLWTKVLGLYVPNYPPHNLSIAPFSSAVVPDAPPDPQSSSCDVIKERFCSNFDMDCCSPCAEETSEYLECIIESSFLQIMCPGASCESEPESGNMTLPEVNTTIIENNTTSVTMPDPMPEITEGIVPGEAIEDLEVETLAPTEDFLSEFCGMQIAEVFGCYLTECSDRQCDTALDQGT